MWRWLKLEHCLDELHTILYFYGKKYGEKSCDYGWDMFPQIENVCNEMTTIWRSREFDKITLGLRKFQVLKHLIKEFDQNYTNNL